MATNIIAIDIGEKRIGVARANVIARIPTPLATLANDTEFINNLNKFIKEYDVEIIVVGLPRNLNGEETAQSKYTRNFIKNKMNNYNLVFQDETLSTVAAKDANISSSAGIDADAACIILSDYMRSIE